MPMTDVTENNLPATETALVRAHGLAALAAVLYAVLLGFTIGLKFHWPDFLGETAWLSWGRLRYGHTQGILFGWLGNAFLAFLYHAVPRLSGRAVASRGLGWLLFGTWNLAVVVPGHALVQAGYSQPLEWAEFPIVIDVFVVIAFVLMFVQFALPLLRVRISELYVSGWYILGAIVFTLLAYPVGNFVPELLPGARGATYSGLWIHDAVGLYVTPFAVSIAYFVIPAATGRAIYSHFLSMLAFWMLFLIYPLNGTHHYLFSAIPMEAQLGAIVASVYLGMDVLLNVANQLLSLKGEAGAVARDVPLRFVWFSIVAYLVVSVQGSLQALMPVNRLVHFTDWVIGHSHLAMIGFASFAAIGGLLHAWKHTPGLRYSERAGNWAFWLLAAGDLLMATDLTAAGLVQGMTWQSESPWIDSVNASRGFWMSRSLAAAPVVLGFISLCLAMLTGPVGRTVAAVTSEVTGDAASAITPPRRAFGLLRSAYVLTAAAGVGCFALSFLVLAVWPNQTLEAEMAASRPDGLPGPSASEERGRAVYAREGCLNCHSQFVRMTMDDVRRFGVPTRAWEAEHDFPQLWGTRRVGPDLAREHGKRPRDWHLIHIFNPRLVVSESIMPGYPWLFDGSPLAPTPEAIDLAAYLDSLGRAGQLAGLSEQSPAQLMDPAEEERMGEFCDCAIPRRLAPAPVISTDLPPIEQARFALRGKQSFARHCASCHGPAGRGDGPAAASLLPAPRDLTSARFSDAALSQVLWRGVPGSAMPGWHAHSIGELRGLAVFVRSLHPSADPKGEPALSPAEHTQAGKLYADLCARCHGATGGGDGLAAATLAPRPTDFTAVRPNMAYGEKALEHGVPGTAMPPWSGKLSAEERRRLARYVQAFAATAR
jgi:cbb3-type cytochrome oxidase subunit 1/cbb3-type cytochrome oxidase cytochrome c subunit/mono/diheme cytochrome c family protein